MKIFKNKISIIDIISYLIIFFAITFTLFPILWAFLASFKVGRDVISFPPKIFFTPTLENYRTIIKGGIIESVISTIGITAGTTFLAVFVGSLAGYGLARFKSWVFSAFGVVIFSMRFLPMAAVIIPLFLLFVNFGLVGTRLGLILAYQIFALPFVLYLMWSFFSRIPVELEEAAWIDGCTRFSAFIRVVLPNSLNGIGAALVLIAILSWNQFFIPLILGGTKMNIITMGILSYSGAEQAAVKWGPLSAWAIVIIAPIIVFTFAVNRLLIRGLRGGIAEE